MKGYLILENGMIFEGNSIGSEKEVISEIVFNTSMTGYLEVLTDPSYAGQAVVMTYPLMAITEYAKVIGIRETLAGCVHSQGIITFSK